MKLSLQIHHKHTWHQAAIVELRDDGQGYEGEATIDYDLEYFYKNASVDYHQGKAVCDHRALSVGYPVDLETRHHRHWPPFLLDLMPQGHARRQLAGHLGLSESARSADIPLLLRAAAGGIGNIRIQQAFDAETERVKNIQRQGVTEKDILDRSDRFLEVADHFAMLASGSSGLQGEWPKVSMTLASDGLYYPDSLVADDEAQHHVIVKLVRSTDPMDQLILKGEHLYSRIAREVGLKVWQTSTYNEGVLIIPRFDRQHDKNGQVVRLGQESLVSAIGVAAFGHVGTHEAYLDIIKQHSSDPVADITEYLKRDIANLALGNPDNHGRNTALTKYPDGSIRLSPLFDFAPMRLAKEAIVRSTRWASMREQGRDHLPDWNVICSEMLPDRDDRARVMLELRQFADLLKRAPQMAKEMGASVEIIERAMVRCAEITDSVCAVAS